MNFNGRVAFVTGAGRGIGRATALELAERGADLALIDINVKELDSVKREAEAFGVRVLTLVSDVSDEESIRSAASAALSHFGHVDILINNAGIYRTNDFLSTDSSAWKRTIDVNILGTMYPTQALLPSMIEQGYGRIINLGSVAGVYGIDYFVDYSMSKGAVISFTKALAKCVSAKGVTVNCVSPGSIDVTGGNNPMKDFSFVGRAGTPEECAHMIVFLASENASYITGQNYLVDGMRKKM